MVKSQPIYYASQTIRAQIADQFRLFFNIALVILLVAVLAFGFGVTRGSHGGEPKNAPECSAQVETHGGACYG